MLAGVHRGVGVQLRVVRNRYPMVPQVLPLSDHRPWLTPDWHLLVATNATRHSSRRPIGAGQTRPIVLAPATHQDSTVGLASCPVAPGEAWGRQAQLFRALAEDRDPLNPGRCVAFCVVVNVVWCRQRSLTGPHLQSTAPVGARGGHTTARRTSTAGSTRSGGLGGGMGGGMGGGLGFLNPRGLAKRPKKATSSTKAANDAHGGQRSQSAGRANRADQPRSPATSAAPSGARSQHPVVAVSGPGGRPGTAPRGSPTPRARVGGNFAPAATRDNRTGPAPSGYVDDSEDVYVMCGSWLTSAAGRASGGQGAEDHDRPSSTARRRPALQVGTHGSGAALCCHA